MIPYEVMYGAWARTSTTRWQRSWPTPLRTTLAFPRVPDTHLRQFTSGATSSLGTSFGGRPLGSRLSISKLPSWFPAFPALGNQKPSDTLESWVAHRAARTSPGPRTRLGSYAIKGSRPRWIQATKKATCSPSLRERRRSLESPLRARRLLTAFDAATGLPSGRA